MKPLVTHPRRIVALCGLASLLAGCAAQIAATPQPAPDITVSDLKMAVHNAYQQGYEAGRHYQRGLVWRRAAPAKAACLSQQQQPAAVLAQPQPAAPLPAQQPQPQPAPQPQPQPAAPQPAPQPQPAPLPKLPPSSNYTTSGPAQPLSQ